MSLLRFYFKMNRGYLRRHGLEFVLCLIGVALGVAVAVGIDAAVVACVSSFRGAVRTVAGQATHSIVAEHGALTDDDYIGLRRHDLTWTLAPLIDRRVAIDSQTGDTHVVRLLGIDPLADSAIRSFTDLESSVDDDTFKRLFCEPRTVVAVSGLAEALNITRGATLEITAPAGRTTVEVVAVIDPPGTLASQIDDVLIVDIATAQELTAALGELDRIDVVLDGPDTRARLEAALPDHLTIIATSTRADQLNEMIAAYKLNLNALSLMASLVAVFIVYNALLVSVQQRANTMAILRCIGASRAQLSGVFMGEALITSLLGSVAGLVCGAVLARILVGYVSGTIDDLYASMRPPAVQLGGTTLIKGVIIGLCSGVCGAAVPLVRASRIPPVTVMRRSATRHSAHRAAWILGGLGGALLAGAGVLVSVPALDSPAVGFLVAALAAVGFTLLCPLLTRAVAVILLRTGRALRSVPLAMAASSVGHSLHITGFAVGAMMLAMAMSLALVTMITSFRAAVGTWLDQRFQADVFVGPQLTIDYNIAAPLDPDVVAWIAEQPEVADMITYRRTTAAIAGHDIQLLGTDVAALLEQDSLPLRHGPAPGVTYDPQRHVLISEPLAGRLGAACGEPIHVEARARAREFIIYAIYFDFTSDRGEALLQDETYRRLYDDPIINSVHVRVRERAVLPDIVSRWGAALESRFPVLVHDYQYVKDESMRIFDRTFRVTDVLAWMSCAVAYCGLVGALIALAMSRRREHGILAAIGMSARQMIAWVCAEGLIIAWVSAAVAVCAGTVLAYILAYVIQYRSFGWSIPMEPQFGLWPGVFGYAGVAAALAAIYPIRRLLTDPPQASLREE